MATNEEYQALIDSLSGECERLHKAIEDIRAEISDMFKHETQDDYWDGYESCRADVLKIIDKHTK